MILSNETKTKLNSCHHIFKSNHRPDFRHWPARNKVISTDDDKQQVSNFYPRRDPPGSLQLSNNTPVAVEKESYKEQTPVYVI